MTIGSLMVRSRGSLIAGALTFLVLVFAVTSALAQEYTEDKDYSSPRRFYLEFKLGPYSPNVDSEFGGTATPFADVFGSGSSVMLTAELDLEVWQGFGTVAVGFAGGYWRTSASAFKDNSPDGGKTPTAATTDRSGSTTGITLAPMALLAIYRFDWLSIKHKVPIVPFAKLGLNYTLWSTDVDGNTSSFAGQSGSGGTFGWQFNLGAALVLDVLEPGAAKNLDNEIGINHTYAFFEFMHLQADGFGSSSVLNVGDTTWMAGLAFEF